MKNETNYDRLLNMFLTYLDEDICEMGVEWVGEKLEAICKEEDLEELGIKDWLYDAEAPEEESDEEPEEDLDEFWTDNLSEDDTIKIDDDEPWREDEVPAGKLSKDDSLTYQVLYRMKGGSTQVGYTEDLGEACAFAHSEGIYDYCIFNQKEKIPIESKVN